MRLAILPPLFLLLSLIPFSSTAQVLVGNDDNLYRIGLGPYGGQLWTDRPTFCEGPNVKNFTINLLCDSLSSIKFQAYSTNCFDNQFNGGVIITSDSRIEFIVDSFNNLQRLDVGAPIDSNQNWLHQSSVIFGAAGYGFAGYTAFGNWENNTCGQPVEGYFGFRVVRDNDIVYGWGYASMAITKSSAFLQIPALAIEDVCNSSVPTAGFRTAFPVNCSGEEVCFENTSMNAQSYLWEFYDGSTSSEASPCMTFPLPGQYPVSLQVTNANGTDTYQSFVTVQRQLSDPVQLQANQLEICEGEMASFHIAHDANLSPQAYQWTLNGVPVGINGAEFSSDSFQDGDVLECCVTTDYRCLESSSLCQQLSVVVQPVVPVEAFFIEVCNSRPCEGDLYEFIAEVINEGSDPVYEWSVNGTPINNNSRTYADSSLQNGDIVTFTVTSSEACTSPSVATLTDVVQYAPLPSVSLEMEDTLCLSNQQLPLTGGTPAGGIYSGPFIRDNMLDLSAITDETTINITYSYVSKLNCSAEVTRPLSLVLCTSLDELEEGLEVAVFPNPSKGYFQLELPEEEGRFDLSVYNVAGQRMLNQSLGAGRQELDLSGWPAGVYLLELVGKDRRGWTRLVVE
ncbi:MAG: PKD domain-containing protein [Bacteroidota bacterium]